MRSCKAQDNSSELLVPDSLRAAAAAEVGLLALPICIGSGWDAVLCLNLVNVDKCKYCRIPLQPCYKPMRHCMHGDLYEPWYHILHA